MTRLPVLDGLRATAALMVMGFHFFMNPHNSHNGQLGEWLSRYSSIGQTGVDLFFVLSGFLITRILLHTRSSPGYFANFYARRSLRILPLYYGFLVLIFLVKPLLVGEALVPFSDQWWWWVNLQNVPMSFNLPVHGPLHYWSLAVEEHFYLLWPLLVWMLDRKRLVWVCLGFIAFSAALRPVFLSLGYSTYFFTLTRVDVLSFGALLAVAEPHFVQNRPGMHRRFLAGLICAAVPLACVYFVFGGNGADWVQLTKYPVTGFLYFSLTGYLVTLESGSLLARLLSSRPMLFLGSISYGLYIYHGLCFDSLDPWIGKGYPLPVVIAAGFGSTIGLAYVSYRFFETPFLRLKHHFAPKQV